MPLLGISAGNTRKPLDKRLLAVVMEFLPFMALAANVSADNLRAKRGRLIRLLCEPYPCGRWKYSITRDTPLVAFPLTATCVRKALISGSAISAGRLTP